MLFYILIFSISVIFVYYASKSPKSFILHVLALLGPILVLSLRDQSVGTDTPHYADILELSSSFNSLIDYLLSTRFEPLFATMLYICSHNKIPLAYVYFISAILSIVPVYYVAIANRKNASPALMMFIFYMLFCSYSFNIMRQTIASAFLVLALYFMVRKEYKKTYFFVLVAFLNHYTSVCFLPIVFLTQLMQTKSKKKIITFSILILIFLPTIISYFANSLDYYQESYLDKGEVVYQNSYIMEMLLNFLILLLAKMCKSRIENYSIYMIISILTLTAIMLSKVAPNIYRVAIMLDMLMLLYIPQIVQKNRTLKIAYITFALFFFWFVFVLNRTCAIIPYHSSIIGI